MSRRTPLLLLDVAAVLVFAALGRRSHSEGVTIVGVLGVAAPFLVGVLFGWLATRAWRRPETVLPVGASIWVAALIVGMVGRRVTGQGTAPSFVVVAAVVLGVLLVGWRGVAAFGSRHRPPPP